MEIISNEYSKVSQKIPAFSLRMMDEKSDPITSPLSPENNNWQMKAILTTDGSIKIIYSPSSPLIMRRPRSKKVFLSKDSMIPSTSTIVSSQSPKYTPKTINLNKNVFNTDDEDEDDRYSQYKMTPREIFMPHVCHVSLNFLN